MPDYGLFTPRAIGALITAERIRQGLAQHELAGLANVGSRFLVELEGGKPTAALGKTIAVLAALGLQPRFEVTLETRDMADRILAEPDAGVRRRHRVAKSPSSAFRSSQPASPRKEGSQRRSKGSSKEHHSKGRAKPLATTP